MIPRDMKKKFGGGLLSRGDLDKGKKYRQRKGGTRKTAERTAESLRRRSARDRLNCVESRQRRLPCTIFSDFED